VGIYLQNFVLAARLISGAEDEVVTIPGIQEVTGTVEKPGEVEEAGGGTVQEGWRKTKIRREGSREGEDNI
jgi:hypothetical protein